MSIDCIIAQAVSKAVEDLYGIDTPAENIVPQATRKEFEGNLTVVVFPWVKAARKAPDAVGQEIGSWLEANEEAVEKFNVVKGFLNITIAPRFWNEVIPPYLVNRDSMQGTGQFPKFTEDVYTIVDNDDPDKPRELTLIPTAEVPLVNYFRGEISSAIRRNLQRMLKLFILMWMRRK